MTTKILTGKQQKRKQFLNVGKVGILSTFIVRDMISSYGQTMYLYSWQSRFQRKILNVYQCFFKFVFRTKLPIGYLLGYFYQSAFTCQSVALKILGDHRASWHLLHCNYYKCMIMSSKANKNHKDDSRLKPTCTRCRNHGIYFVPLKGHRNVCPFKLCSCQDCVLIFERRQVVVKPHRQTAGAPNKSSRRKRTLKELEGHKTGKQDGALIPGATMSVFLPPSLTKRKGNTKPFSTLISVRFVFFRL